MPKRVPLKITGPLALRVNWLERLVPERHLSGTTAEERARLAYTLGLLLFCIVTTGITLLWGFFDPQLSADIYNINLIALLCYSVDLILFFRFGRARWLVFLVVLHLLAVSLLFLALGGQLAFLIWLLGPPMLLMFLDSLTVAYMAAAIAVLAALAVGYLRERGLLATPEPAGFWALMDVDALAINTWIFCQLPLMMVFDIRRSWAAGEAHLITRILLNAKQQTRTLLAQFREQIEALAAEPGLAEQVREDLQETQLSAQRLNGVMDTLAQIAQDEPTAARKLRHRLERIGDDAPGSTLTSERSLRFLLRVSLSMLAICCVLLPIVLLVKGFAYPLSWLTIAAVVLLVPNVVLLRRGPVSRLTLAWLTLQVVVLCVFGVLVTGDMTQAIWLSHLPIALLYAAGVRWALSSVVPLIVLVSVLPLLLQAGYGLPQQAPLSGSVHLDKAGFSGLFIVTGILLIGYFERDRMRSALVLTLRGSALSRFSHELRTPLNGILGTLGLLREELPAEGALPGHLSLAERYAQQLSSLIDDALSLAVLSGGRVERKVTTFSLRQLEAALQQEVEPLSELHLTDVDVTYEPAGPERLAGEYGRLETMLLSLLEWACEHRPGQSIMLRLSVRQQARNLWCLEVALLDSDRSVNDDRVGGLADLFVQDHQGLDRNALRVALCRAQVDYLGGRLQSFEKISRGLLLSLPLKQS